MYDIAIIGGGLAGLINAILLNREGLSVILIEKKNYPFHRVCGEYVSNEVRPFLQRNGLFPYEYNLPNIKNLSLTAVNGRKSDLHLDLGGFGISRYSFDAYLVREASKAGVKIIENTSIETVKWVEDHFEVANGNSQFHAKLVIGTHGKRSKLDANLNRRFLQHKSPYLAVKYHIKTDLSSDTIALHNFKGGYCGVSQVEGEKFNLCYLSHRDNLRRYKDISVMEQAILYENPRLKSIFQQSDFLFDKPLVINEITFEKKSLVHDHILMSGDAAGMITPLCGNGMAMAIHAAKLLSETIARNWKGGNPDRITIETDYAAIWNHYFNRRLWFGRKIQRLFGSNMASNMAVGLARITPISNRLVRLTHGQPF